MYDLLASRLYPFLLFTPIYFLEKLRFPFSVCGNDPLWRSVLRKHTTEKSGEYDVWIGTKIANLYEAEQACQKLLPSFATLFSTFPVLARASVDLKVANDIQQRFQNDAVQICIVPKKTLINEWNSITVPFLR